MVSTNTSLGLPDGVHGCLQDGVAAFEGSVRYVRAVTAAGLRRAVVSSSANCQDVLVAAGIEGLFEARIDSVGVDRAGQAAALKSHGADIVVTDLADLLDRP